MTDTKVRKVEAWPIENIFPYEKNAKKHSDEQVDGLVQNIREFGWDQPIVVDKDGVIIKGHGRRLAAMKMGLKKVPVICRDDLSPDQVKAARLSDNRIVSTEYDNDLLMEELGELDADFDLGALGFSDKELAFLDADIADIDESAFTEDIETAVSEQQEENAAAARDVDESEIPIGDALGFKKVTVSEKREIGRFMAEIEDQTVQTGKDALMTFIRGVMSDD